MFNLSSRSLFIGADLICYIGKSIEKSSLRRYWWDGCHETCLNVSLPLTGNFAVYICVSLPSLSYLVMLTWLWIVGNPATTSDKSKELTLHAHSECGGLDIFGPTHSYFLSPRSYLILCTKAHPSTCGLLYISGDTLFGCHPASGVFLQRMMVLYIARHFKNQPNDLQLMSNAPAHHLFVLFPLIKYDGWLKEWRRYDSMVDHSAFSEG